MPAFLIDKCVSLQMVWLFKALGLSYKTVYDIALSGKSDSAVFKTAQDMKSVRGSETDRLPRPSASQ